MISPSSRCLSGVNEKDGFVCVMHLSPVTRCSYSHFSFWFSCVSKVQARQLKFHGLWKNPFQHLVTAATLPWKLTKRQTRKKKKQKKTERRPWDRMCFSQSVCTAEWPYRKSYSVRKKRRGILPPKGHALVSLAWITPVCVLDYYIYTQWLSNIIYNL